MMIITNNGVKARERTFSSKQVKKLEGVVLNRVRVSNAQWLTYSQYWSSNPPPSPHVGGFDTGLSACGIVLAGNQLLCIKGS